MKKQTILSKSIAAMASLALCATVAHAASLQNGSTTGAGELFVGFTATGGTGAGKSVVIDLGNALAFSNSPTGTTLSLGQYGADLVSTFGSTWYTRTDLSWGAVAAVGSSVPSNIATDPTNTIYGSQAVSAFNPAAAPSTTAFNRATNGTQAPVAQRILQNMATGTGGFSQSATGSSASNVAIEAAGSTQNWQSWMVGGSNVSGLGNTPFGGFTSEANFAQSFSSTAVGAAAGSDAVGALDVYRMVRSNATDSEASPTTGTGAGSYQFSLAVDSAGIVTLGVDSVPVPEPASFGALTSAALLGIGMIRRKRGARA